MVDIGKFPTALWLGIAQHPNLKPYSRFESLL